MRKTGQTILLKGNFIMWHHETIDIHTGNFLRKGYLMLHHLAGVTKQVANYLNYNCQPQLKKGKPMTSVTSDFSNKLLQNKCVRRGI